MLERLLELLLHAKSGVFASVLVLGTTGALVTATVATAGNVTTITLTQASASPSAEVQLQSPAASPRTPKLTTEEPSSSPSNATSLTTKSTTTCTADSGAADAVKTVDTAFSTFHTDLMKLRTDNKGDAGKSIIEKADKSLKQIRHEAVKAIHAAANCKTDTKDDEDKTEQDNDKVEKDIEDQNDDNDPTSTARSTGTDSNLLAVFFNNLFGKHGTTVTTNAPTTPTTTTTTTTVTGDAKTIADNAVAAMKVVFDSAKADLAKLATSAATPKTAKSPEHSDKKGDKGKGQSGEHKGGDD